MQHAENVNLADLLKEDPHEALHNYIDNMDEYQARLVLSFIKTLFNLAD